MVYLLIIVLILALVIHYDIKGKTHNKVIYYNLVLVLLIFVAGLRYRLGADTTNYLYSFYHTIPELGNLKPDLWNWDEEPLFRLINSFVKTLGGPFYIVQFIEAAFVNILLFKYIKKHSDYIFTCVFFYVIWMYTFYNMEEMRASMALVVALFANDYVLEKKWIKSTLLFVVAGLFHKTAYVLMLASVLFFPLRKNLLNGIFFGLGAFFIGIFVQENFGDYLYLLDVSMAATEDMAQYMKMTGQMDQEGRNLMFFFVNVLPFIVYPSFSLFYTKKYNETSKVLQVQPMIIMGIAFVAIQASMQLAYRFVHFYAIYLIMIMAQMFIDVVRNERSKRRGKATTWSYIKAFVLVIPLMAVLIRAQLDTYTRYYPYSSVIEKSINYEREKEYDHAANSNEY